MVALLASYVSVVAICNRNLSVLHSALHRHAAYSEYEPRNATPHPQPTHHSQTQRTHERNVLARLHLHYHYTHRPVRTCHYIDHYSQPTTILPTLLPCHPACPTLPTTTPLPCNTPPSTCPYPSPTHSPISLVHPNNTTYNPPPHYTPNWLNIVSFWNTSMLLSAYPPR
jgi:hypothetical protein